MGKIRRRCRRPVGRRGKGQGRRPADRARDRGRALPGRPQCRSHAGDRRPQDGPVADTRPACCATACAASSAMALSLSLEALLSEADMLAARGIPGVRTPADQPATARWCCRRTSPSTGARAARAASARSARPDAASVPPTRTRLRAARCGSATCSSPGPFRGRAARARSTATTSCWSTTSRSRRSIFARRWTNAWRRPSA